MMNIFQDDLYLDQAKRVAVRMDLASQQDKELFDTPWYRKHFTMGEEHVAENFETVLDKMHMTIAASTIQRKSEMPLRALEGIDTISQSMFTYAHAFRIETDELRRLLNRYYIAVANKNTNSIERIKKDMFDKIYEVKSKAVEGIRTRIDTIVLGGLFNKGVFEFTEKNDPGSPFVGSKIDFHMPVENQWEVEAGGEWTLENVDNFDVVKDFSDIRNKAKGRKPKFALVSREKMDIVLQSKKLMGMINDYTKPNMPLSDEIVNTFLSARGLPTFEVVEREVLIQDGDMLVPYSPINGDNVVLIPDTIIGTIETRLSDVQMGLGEDDIKYSYYDRIELHEYELGEKQGTTLTKMTKAILTAAPAVSAINYIHSLKTVA